MSQRSNAPYVDRILDDGITIEYEGHDVPQTKGAENAKLLDQVARTAKGTFTQNGLFARAAEEYRIGKSKPEIVRVYEKILAGIWSEKGFFILKDYTLFHDGKRHVFRFLLEETEVDLQDNHLVQNRERPRSRIIPTAIKKIVWERDEGKCVMCGASDELHFDHDLPFSKGGTSVSADNVKILCARHNLSKSDKIE